MFRKELRTVKASLLTLMATSTKAISSQTFDMVAMVFASSVITQSTEVNGEKIVCMELV